jgi:hypothetical protein
MSDSINKERKDGLSSFKIVLILFTLYGGGSFGLSIQKGMIESMGLGNMQGSYSVNELIGSTVFGLLYVFEKVPPIDWTSLIFSWDSLFSGSVAFFVLYIMGVLMFQKDHPWIKKCNDFLSFSKNVQSIKEDKGHKKPIIMAFLGFFAVILSKYVAPIIILAIVACSLLIPTLGLTIGENRIKDAKKTLPCKSLAQLKSTEPDTVIRQCTNFVIKQHAFKGRIWLENDKGFFIQVNGAFLYIAKDGGYCASAKYGVYKNFKDRKEKIGDGFEKSLIDKSCQVTEEIINPKETPP